jgi:5-methylcytosine-specific restriction endonuclease McrA
MTQGNFNIHPMKIVDVNYIKNAYLSGKTACEIAKEIGVSSTLIYHRLEDNNIKHSKSEAAKIRHLGVGNQWAQKYNVDIDKIVTLYINNKLPAIDVGKVLNLPRHTIYYYLNKHNISRRKGKEAYAIELSRKRLSDGKKNYYKKNPCVTGSAHFNWKGGLSREEYGEGWTKQIRHKVKNRDKNICLYCYEKGSKDRPLFVHHIDYNKKNNNIDNLVSLHSSCHTSTNWNRVYWHYLYSLMNSEVEDNSPFILH